MSLRRTTLIQGPPGPGTFSAAPVSWTPGLITNGAFAKKTIALATAIAGVPVWAAWSAVLPDGVIVWAQTIAAGSVAVYILNLSGSSQTIGAGNIYVEALTS